MNASARESARSKLRRKKFRRQLRRLIEASESDPNGAAALKERCAKAIEYFTGQIATQLIAALHEHVGALARKKKVKRYVNHVRLIEESCWSKIERLYNGRLLEERLYSGEMAHTRSANSLAKSDNYR